jgi:hypothetical protein
METCFRDAGPGSGLFAGVWRISEKRRISQKVRRRRIFFEWREPR